MLIQNHHSLYAYDIHHLALMQGFWSSDIWFSGKLFSSLNFGQVILVQLQTDGQKAMYKSPPCKNTGVLNEMNELFELSE